MRTIEDDRGGIGVVNVSSDVWKRLTYTLAMLMGSENEVEEWFK